MPELASGRALRVCALYPDLMNIYADRGNLLLLERRCLWRRIGCGVILAVCGGYQLLGHSYQLGKESLPGAGLVDLHTVRSEGPRLIGNVAIEVELELGRPRVLAGFDTHGGRTYLGPGTTPLGRVLKGHGNNGKDGHEGVRT